MVKPQPVRTRRDVKAHSCYPQREETRMLVSVLLDHCINDLLTTLVGGSSALSTNRLHYPLEHRVSQLLGQPPPGLCCVSMTSHFRFATVAVPFTRWSVPLLSRVN